MQCVIHNAVIAVMPDLWYNQSMFILQKISCFIDKKQILKNVDLDIPAGQVHALMGANGSGKSTLVHTAAGDPFYDVSGVIFLNGENISELSVHERARKGLLVSFQQPPAIPGLSVFTFLTETYRALVDKNVNIISLKTKIESALDILQMKYSFMERNFNDGFSGGERKRFELLQLLLFKPSMIILDEIDSGLDIDALKLVSQIINQLKQENAQTTVLLITHYQRIFDYIKPDRVHVLHEGVIQTSGDYGLVAQIEKQGYRGYTQTHTP